MLTTLVLASLGAADASSHREAPAIARDPSADLTDFYAFVSPEDPTKVVFIMNVNPLSAPGGGPNFHSFDDDVGYLIAIDNEGDAEMDLGLIFNFNTTYQYPDEFLYNIGDINDPLNVNHTQTMNIQLSNDGVMSTIATGLPVAPANVGVVSDGLPGYTPGLATPGPLTTSHISTVAGGLIRVFAGPRQEGFYVDLERTFDLLNLGGVGNLNTLLGYNTSSIAVEVPMNMLTKDGAPPSALAQNEVIMSWSGTFRQEQRTLNTDGTATNTGPWRQVARLGNPLVNEVVIPVGMKDRFSASHPRDDAQFLPYVTDPILPIYMELILGVVNPLAHDEGLGIGGREDLVLAFLTGHTALATQPGGFVLGGPIPGEPGKVFAAYEAMRMNLTTTSGWPNGRYVTDDVVDTALSAMGGLLIDGTVVTDGVDSTGLNYLTTFPFLGDPWTGDSHPMGFHP